jgi:hypothetical protein
MNETRPTPPAGAAEVAAAEEALARTEHLRRLARRDTQGLAIPLLVLGPLTVLAAALPRLWLWWMVRDLGPGESRSATDGELAFTNVVDTYWGTVGALGLLAIGLWFGLRSRRLGAGAGAGAWVAAAVAVFVLVAYNRIFVWVPFLLPLTMVSVLAPSAVIALALLLVAWRRHNGRLAAWAVVFGVVTVLASLGFFDNRLYDLLGLVRLPTDVVLAVGGWGDLIAQVALGVAMVVTGLRARRADQSAPVTP